MFMLKGIILRKCFVKISNWYISIFKKKDILYDVSYVAIFLWDSETLW